MDEDSWHLPLNEIGDRDIENIEKVFDCSFGNERRREALRCISSRDIQAGPGSGKTTLLVAKLAILSSKWTCPDRGICVLSHTNVAREEVERRVSKHPTAHRLLDYPHFIGTIQSFVDQFLALPYLRSIGTDVSMVDNDRFASRSTRLIRDYQTALGYINLRPKTWYPILQQLRFEGPRLRLGSAGPAISIGESTKTHQQLSELKRRISDEGIFRFDDMYAYAEAVVESCPWIVESLRYRFPWVFIDEMQDTEAAQESLLDRIFGNGPVVQRFGDVNQGIYSDENESSGRTSFPKAGYIDIPDCLRFGSAIAAFASPFTAVEPQILIGNSARPGRRHTIFLFNETTIQNVLPAFGDLLAQEFASRLPDDFVAKAVGFRKAEPQTQGQREFPYNVRDYWRPFQPQLAPRGSRPDHLIDFVRKARFLVRKQREGKAGYDVMLDGLLELLYWQGVKHSNGVRFTKGLFLENVRGWAKDRRSQFYEMLAELVLSTNALDQIYWQQVRSGILELLGLGRRAALTFETQSLLDWSDLGTEGRHSHEADLTSSNVYHHPHSRLPTNIEVATIHSVKGETHTATLVLETYLRKRHDLRVLLPFLTGTGSPRLITQKKLTERMKCIFVGITRPMELLCLAMCKEHLNFQDIDALGRKGWFIQDLTVA